MTKSPLVKFLLSASFLGLMGCGNGTIGNVVNSASNTQSDGEAQADGGSTTVSLTQGYISSRVVLGSPVEFEEDESTGETISRYQSLEQQLEAILSAENLEGCVPNFDFDLSQAGNAECYGPTISYTNHPNFVSQQNNFDPARDGDLPHGDLGIWEETNADGEACAAAQLKIKLGNIETNSLAAYKVVASMLCVANQNNMELPLLGEVTDLTQAMNDAAAAQNLPLTFSLATIGVEGDASVNGQVNANHIYQLDFTNTAKGKKVSVNFEYTPFDEEDTLFFSKLYFVLDAPDDARCGAVNNKTSIASSLIYDAGIDPVTQGPMLTMQARSGNFCSQEIDPFVEGILNPALKYKPENQTFTGWWGNFSIFTSQSNPENNNGNYTYVWQAGVNDSNTRIFNLRLDSSDPQNPIETLAGYAFSGYGAPITETDGTITRFICNWAGPSNNHQGVAKVQMQHITFEPQSGIFISDPDQTFIQYAPTNSCDSAGAPFVFDGISTAITNELQDLSAITQVGFELPLAPSISVPGE